MDRRALLLLPLIVCVALPATGVAARKPKERQVDARAATGTLPKIAPVGRLKASERSVLLRIRTASDASVEALFQIFCFDKQLRLKRVRRTVRGRGLVTATLKRPRGLGLGCSTDASVRVSSRPAPASGSLRPVRVGAALYARR